MPGPLAQVDTLIAGIGFDIDRTLDWEDTTPIIFEFIVPDRSQSDKWRVLLTLTEGFNRISTKEKTEKDGSEVIFQVADLAQDGSLQTALGTQGLHVRTDGEIFTVSTTPAIAPNEAQVYTLTCKVRTKRTNFDTSR